MCICDGVYVKLFMRFIYSYFVVRPPLLCYPLKALFLLHPLSIGMQRGVRQCEILISPLPH
jgi:hypothetical protein